MLVIKILSNNQNGVYTMTNSILEKENQIIVQARQIISDRILNQSVKFTSAKIVADYGYLHLRELPHEEFHLIILDSSHAIIKDVKMSTGTVGMATVYTREVVKECLLNSAAACILMHNHPSGLTQPSLADLNITKKIIEALKTVDIDVLDHLIIGNEYYSFACNGDI